MASPSPFMQVETEHLVYPFSSLVAELGGVLGLFLGVSCITLWDTIEKITGVIHKIKD